MEMRGNERSGRKDDGAVVGDVKLQNENAFSGIAQGCRTEGGSVEKERDRE